MYVCTLVDQTGSPRLEREGGIESRALLLPRLLTPSFVFDGKVIELPGLSPVQRTESLSKAHVAIASQVIRSRPKHPKVMPIVVAVNFSASFLLLRKKDFC
jgi:hypothetical protein